MLEKPGSSDTPVSNESRVLMIASTFPSNERDGRPAFVLDLARVLARNHRVAVLAPTIQGEKAEDWPGIEVHRFSYFLASLQGLADEAILPTLRREPWRWIEVPFFILAMLAHTVRLSRRLKPQVVNAHWIVPGGLVARVAKTLTGVPYVVTVHGADAHGIDSTVGRAVKRWVLRGSDRVVPVSETARSALLELDSNLAPLTTEPVPMGVSAPRESDQADRQIGAFLFIGRLAEKKGLIDALDAIAESEKASLLVIGTGPEEDRIRKRINELGLQDRVTLLGRLDRLSVFRHLNSCTGVIIPSIVASDGDQDGTPVVLAECAVTGTPVVASTVAGLRENVRDGETGLLFPPGDTSALTERINWALANPAEFLAMGKAARDRFTDSPLDIATTSSRYSAIFREVTGP